MNKTAIHNIAIAILTLPVFILSVFKPIVKVFSKLSKIFYSQWKRTEFKTCPRNVIIEYKIEVGGGNNISIGNHVRIGKDVMLYTHPHYNEQELTPSIIIGDNSRIGRRSHLTSIQSICIGNGVRMGNDIFITDNAHGGGDNIVHQLDIAPNLRPLYSKGPVIIADRVWIGDKVIILPGVSIGEGAIVGAGAVVTHNIPAYSVAVGNPARVVKTLK